MRDSIVITGAAKRIGLYLTEYLLKNQYNVIAVIRTSSDDLDKLKEKYPFQLSVEVKDFLLENIDINFWNNHKEQKIIGFIHCASLFNYDNVYTTNTQLLQNHNKVNCDVFVDACTSYMQSPLTEQISCIAFLDAKVNKLNSDHYSYTLSKLKLKAAIELLSMACVEKLRVNAISPGLTLPSGEQTNEDFQRVQQQLPLKTTPKLVEIAKLVLFLIETKSITNQNIVIDGGQNLINQKDIIFN